MDFTIYTLRMKALRVTFCDKVSKPGRKQPKTPLLGHKLLKVEGNIQIGTMIAVPANYNIGP